MHLLARILLALVVGETSISGAIDAVKDKPITLVHLKPSRSTTETGCIRYALSVRTVLAASNYDYRDRRIVGANRYAIGPGTACNVNDLYLIYTEPVDVTPKISCAFNAKSRRFDFDVTVKTSIEPVSMWMSFEVERNVSPQASPLCWQERERKK